MEEYGRTTAGSEQAAHSLPRASTANKSTMLEPVVPPRGWAARQRAGSAEPAPLPRQSIGIRACVKEAPEASGVIALDTVAHCGPTLIGEFSRTWAMHEVAIWLRARDIDQTRSPVYEKNERAYVGSKNNHFGGKQASYWPYDSTQEMELLNPLWASRRKNPSDTPPPAAATAWQRPQTSGALDAHHVATLIARIEGINPADPQQRRRPRRHPPHRPRSTSPVRQPIGHNAGVQALPRAHHRRGIRHAIAFIAR